MRTFNNYITKCLPGDFLFAVFTSQSESGKPGGGINLVAPRIYIRRYLLRETKCWYERVKEGLPLIRHWEAKIIWDNPPNTEYVVNETVPSFKTQKEASDWLRKSVDDLIEESASHFSRQEKYKKMGKFK